MPLKIGLFAIGLDTYWPQFEGLQQNLESNLQQVAAQLTASFTATPHPAASSAPHPIQSGGIPTLINAGLVDNIDKAFEAGSLFRREEVDLIFLYVSTYALSSTVLPVVQKAKVPVIILNLSPEAAIDYTAFNAMQDRTKMTGEWLKYCSACPVPEIANVFTRAGIKFHQVTGILRDDPITWKELGEWIEAAHVGHTLSYNRMGCMGHYYSGMLDIYTDLTQQYAQFGGHIELLEVEELASLRKEVTPAQAAGRVQLFREVFDVQPDCSPAELEKAAITSVALNQLVAKYQLGSMAYYYKGTGNKENEDTINSIILGNSLLTVVEQAGGKLLLLVAEAESVAGPILQIGNTNSRYRFPIGARNFVNQWNQRGPAHHCAVGIGHISAKIEKLASLLNMDFVRIC